MNVPETKFKVGDEVVLKISSLSTTFVVVATWFTGGRTGEESWVTVTSLPRQYGATVAYYKQKELEFANNDYAKINLETLAEIL